MKLRIEVACAVQHSHDINPVMSRIVENHIPFERETAQPGQ